jgi:tRNA(Ile)-lysidine synthetase-like protein
MLSFLQALCDNPTTTFNYNEFNDVLEFIPTQKQKISSQIIIQDTDIIKTIKNSCENKKNKPIIISLSGGVDSMVLITILHTLKYNIITVHINYNNRQETINEEKFLVEWCKFNDIKLYVKSINEIKRETTKRSDYELITKNMRLDFYKEIMAKENAEYVMLAHHKDDIIENIFANVCRGRNILDLAVLKEHAVISGINIFRPMLEYYKNTIYEFANTYQVPYFKDTTPNWSVRGKYRNLIYPAIEDSFTSNVKENLIKLSNQSDEWNELLNKQIITPFINKIVWDYDTVSNTKSVSFNIEDYIDYPLAFWNVVFMHLFNQFGYHSPSRKGILTFINTIKQRNNTTNNTRFNVTLCNTCKCTIKKYKVMIEFKNN